jgi:hypothetical protein
MLCGECGSEIPGTETACPVCGHALPQGVGGWLLFFIFTLVFFGPIARIWGVAHGYRRFAEGLATVPHPYSVRAFYFAEVLVGFVLCAYGMFAGIQLWRARPGAVARAKQFLLVYLGLAFVDYVMAIIWLVLMMPNGRRSLALSKFLGDATYRRPLSAGFYVTLWYAYLWTSVRVRLTFPENPKVVGVSGSSASEAATHSPTQASNIVE